MTCMNEWMGKLRNKYIDQYTNKCTEQSTEQCTEHHTNQDTDQSHGLTDTEEGFEGSGREHVEIPDQYHRGLMLGIEECSVITQLTQNINNHRRRVCS